VKTSANGITLTTAQDALDRAQGIFKSVYGNNVNLDPSGATGLLVQQIANAIMERDSNIAYLLNSLNPYLAAGTALDAICANLDIYRKPAGYSEANCLVTGLAGTVITAGSQVISTNQDIFAAKVDLTIGSDGQGTGIFVAIKSGQVPVAENTITAILQGVNGWDSINNPEAGTVGQLQESDYELRNRFLLAQAAASTASFLAIEEGIAALENLIAFKLLENKDSSTQTLSGIALEPHSICLVIAGADDNDIAQSLFTNKSAGCNMTGTTTATYPIPNTAPIEYFTAKFIRPLATELNINITLANGFSYSPSIQEDIVDLINSQWIYNQLNTPIYATTFCNILESGGIAPIVSLTLSAGDQEQVNTLVLPITQYVSLPLTTDNISISYG
jgi:hypothetical protein